MNLFEPHKKTIGERIWEAIIILIAFLFIGFPFLWGVLDAYCGVDLIQVFLNL